MEIFVGLFIAFAIITLVGHCIWLILAWMFRLITSSSEAKPPSPTLPRDVKPKRCPRCDGRMISGWCEICGWPQQRPKADSSMRALAATLEQLDSYRKLGLLDEALHKRLTASLDEELNNFTHPAPTDPFVVADQTHRIKPEVQTPPAADTSPAESSPFATMPATTPMQSAEVVPEPIAAELVEAVEVSPEPKPVVDRAREYAANQAVAMARETAERERLAALPPPEPKRPLSDVLLAFMEEKHIRWGELVGGLLIVCCSIALVISFWSEISERPFLKFFVFNGTTAALFALGLYSHYRWQLKTTSQGVLLIATLLAPLNFLAIAAFNRSSDGIGPLMIAGEIASIALFSALTYYAGKVLVSKRAIVFVVGVIAPSVVQLLVRRWVTPGSDEAALLALGSLPVAIFAVVNLWPMWADRKLETFEPTHVTHALMLLGISTFAAILPLGLLVSKTGQPLEMAHRLSVLICGFGLTPLAVGLQLWRKCVGRDVVKMRMTGLSVAVLGAGLMVAGVVLAWPDPISLLPAALLVFAMLTAVAIVFRMPEAHWPAAVCLTLAYLLVWHLALGNFGWRDVGSQHTVDVLFSGVSGQALLILTALFAIAAGVAEWLKRTGDRWAFSCSAGATALISLAMVSWFGFGVPGDPLHVAWIYIGYAALILVGGERLNLRAVRIVGSLLLLVACVQGLVFARELQMQAMPWATALLVYSTLLLALLVFKFWQSSRLKSTEADDVYFWSSLVSSGAAIVGLAMSLPEGDPNSLAAHWIWLALIWLSLAVLVANEWLFAAFQIGLTLAVGHVVAGWLQNQPWYAASKQPWFDPRSWQAEAISLTALSLIWSGLRAFFVRPAAALPTDAELAAQPVASPNRWRELLDSPLPTIDRLITRLAIGVAVALSFYAMWPGAARELSGSSPATLWIYEIANVPHVPAQSEATWLLLAVAIAALLAEMFQRRAVSLVLWLLPAVWGGFLLASSSWEADQAGASAAEWLMMLFFLAGSLAIWWQRQIVRVGPWRDWPAFVDPANLGFNIKDAFVFLLILLGVTPTLCIAGHMLGASPLNAASGPLATSIFARIGAPLNYGLPVLAVAAIFVGYALRQRSAGFALAGGLIGNLAVTVIYFLDARGDWDNLTAGQAIELAQLNAIWSAAFGLAWIGTLAWWRKSQSLADARPSIPLYIQIAIPTLLNIAVLLPSWLLLILDPLYASSLINTADIWGWLAAGLTVVALITFRQRTTLPQSTMGGFVAIWIIVTLVACTFCRWDKSDWLGFHALLAGHILAAWALALGGWRRERRAKTLADADRASDVRWSLVAWSIAVALSWRAEWGDPDAPNWTIAGLAAMSGLACWLAWFAARRTLLYAAAGCINLAASVAWIHYQTNTFWRLDFVELIELVQVNVVALAAPSVLWLLLERLLQRRRFETQRGAANVASMVVPLHRLVARLSLAVMTLNVGLYLFAGIVDQPSDMSRTWEWLAIGATAFAAIVCLWDAAARDSVAGLYFLGLIVCAAVLEQSASGAKNYWWLGNTILAGYALLTSYLWSRREGLRHFAEALRMPLPPVALASASLPTLPASVIVATEVEDAKVEDGLGRPSYEKTPMLAASATKNEFAGLMWLTPLNCLLVVAVTILSFGIDLTFQEIGLRMLAAKCVIFQMATLGMLARGERRWYLQYAALGIGVLGAIALAWSPLTPGVDGTLLNRSVAVVGALAVIATLYGLVLSKWLAAGSEWLRAALRMMPVLVAGCGVAIVLVLVGEASFTIQGSPVEMAYWAIATIAISLTALACAGIAAAVLPGRDPLGLSERGRMVYVYAAEVLVALLFLHIRLTMPWLFHGFFARDWPIIVMALAFVWVGVGQWLQRRWRVLGVPMENTGAILPLAPVIGFWLMPSGINIDYSLLLLAVGVLYAAMATARKSFGFGLLSILAANAGLWYFLGRQDGYRLLEHPQLWLIPPATCVLIAAQLMRKQLSTAQMTTIRYSAATVAYVASTADIFIQGVATAPWLPIVLGGLSLLGVAAGIVLRVRAFLILGTSFLALSLLTVIWYAAVDLHQTWIWAVTGIVTGVAIVVMFAIFEKQRQKVRDVLEKIKDWQ